MSAKYIKTDSWTYVNPSPSLACLFLRALYTFKTIRPIFQIILPHSYNLETKGDLSLSFSLSLSSLSSCEFFGNCAKNFPTRLYRYELYLPSFLTLFSRINLGISRPNLFVSRANIFQRLFYESLADRNFCNRVSCSNTRGKN